MHGHGELVVGNTVYEGEFVDGQRQGVGHLTNDDGSVYHGEFDHDVKHGFGIIQNIKSMELYIGDWREGNHQGFGISLSLVTGLMYFGEWGGTIGKHGYGNVLQSDAKRVRRISERNIGSIVRPNTPAPASPTPSQMTVKFSATPIIAAATPSTPTTTHHYFSARSASAPMLAFTPTPNPALHPLSPQVVYSRNANSPTTAASPAPTHQTPSTQATLAVDLLLVSRQTLAMARNKAQCKDLTLFSGVWKNDNVDEGGQGSLKLSGGVHVITGNFQGMFPNLGIVRGMLQADNQLMPWWSLKNWDRYKILIPEASTLSWEDKWTYATCLMDHLRQVLQYSDHVIGKVFREYSIALQAAVDREDSVHDILNTLVGAIGTLTDIILDVFTGAHHSRAFISACVEHELFGAIGLQIFELMKQDMVEEQRSHETALKAVELDHTGMPDPHTPPNARNFWLLSDRVQSALETEPPEQIFSQAIKQLLQIQDPSNYSGVAKILCILNMEMAITEYIYQNHIDPEPDDLITIRQYVVACAGAAMLPVHLALAAASCEIYYECGAWGRIVPFRTMLKSLARSIMRRQAEMKNEPRGLLFGDS
jgi:hypothetical protein